MYVKASDGAGMPNFKKYTISEYEENNNLVNVPQTPTEHVCKCGDKFVSKDDFDALQAKFDELTAVVNDIKSKPTAKSAKTTKSEVE